MEAPNIQYALTGDGVNIAYYAMGKGAPLVYLSTYPFEHLELDWRIGERRRFYEPFVANHRMVRFDGRGVGLSEGAVTDFSLDARVLDVEAIVDRLSVDRFALRGFLFNGPVAVAYAVRHPERVSHLVLFEAVADAHELSGLSTWQAIRGLVDTDWNVAAGTIASMGSGWEAGEPARAFAQFMRACVSQAVAKRVLEAWQSFDVTPVLPQLRVPTLVLQREGVPLPTVSSAKRLAALIPNPRHVSSGIVEEAVLGNVAR